MSNWKNGILGVVVGDALGCPVQFESREEVRQHPVTGMRGYGTFNLPEGSWTDDSSLTLALLDAIEHDGNITIKHVADNFVKWLLNGEYTPYGYAYDIGAGCMNGIKAYMRTKWPMSGGKEEQNNGNGSLMRIMPACLYCATKVDNFNEAMELIENVSSITHAHKRARIACGIYYCIVKAILGNDGDFLVECIQQGIDKAFDYYGKEKELSYYDRIKDVATFTNTPEFQIKSSGYVVDSLEASLWCLANTSTYKYATLKAVNLGGDTDTISAIAGGLAGLYYGIGDYNGIPTEWIAQLKRKDWILDLCEDVEMKMA